MRKRTLLLCLLSAGMMWTPAAAAVTEVHADVAVADSEDQVISGMVEDANGPRL